ncbi:hypothetical protein [Microbulbifer sp. SAOS-129_SWC]|uniref:hypothetical protein n=1 Tax=Microbulbifer sp. SAOS-129_SWC TaxID=3145235 RepID=UPI003217321A
MAGWLPLIIILLAVVLVVGPVMWLKPSSRDRRLADLRQRAARAGMSVQMQPLPAALGEGSAAVYTQRWRDRRRLQLGWSLELQRMEHEMHFAGRWDWSGGRSAPEPAWEPLRELLAQLPRDACAVVASDSGLGVQWHEDSGESGMAALEGALPEFGPSIEEAIRQPRREEPAPE